MLVQLEAQNEQLRKENGELETQNEQLEEAAEAAPAAPAPAKTQHGREQRLVTEISKLKLELKKMGRTRFNVGQYSICSVCTKALSDSDSG